MRKRFAVIEHRNGHDRHTIERHETRTAAERAAGWLNEHEARCARDRAAGDPHAIRADRPGRPYAYTVEDLTHEE